MELLLFLWIMFIGNILITCIFNVPIIFMKFKMLTEVVFVLSVLIIAVIWKKLDERKERVRTKLYKQ